MRLGVYANAHVLPLAFVVLCPAAPSAGVEVVFERTCTTSSARVSAPATAISSDSIFFFSSSLSSATVFTCALLLVQPLRPLDRSVLPIGPSVYERSLLLRGRRYAENCSAPPRHAVICFHAAIYHAISSEVRGRVSCFMQSMRIARQARTWRERPSQVHARGALVHGCRCSFTSSGLGSPPRRKRFSRPFPHRVTLPQPLTRDKKLRAQHQS